MNVPDSTGEVKQISGLVDYVTVTDGKAYFHIGDEYYSSDYLDSVVSLDYLQHLIDQDKANNTTEDTTKSDDSTSDDTTGSDTSGEDSKTEEA